MNILRYFALLCFAIKNPHRFSFVKAMRWKDLVLVFKGDE